MASTKKQVKRLKKDAQRLWSDQQDLLNRANGVARDAIPHAQHFAESFYDDRVRPTVKKGQVGAKAAGKAGSAAGKYAGSTAKDAVRGVVLPAGTSALAAALALVEEGGKRIGAGTSDLAGSAHDAQKKLGKANRSGKRSAAKAAVKLKAARKAGEHAAKHGSKRIAKATGRSSGIGVGGVIGILLGVGLLAGIGYAVWQTLRADDDLWVADEDPETTPGSDKPTA